MAKEKICGIYKIENIVDGKIYIGQTTNFKVRLYNHISELNRNVHRNEYLQNAVNKYGIENFTFEIIERCDEESIDGREEYWMNYYNSCNRDCGYNLVLGGNSNKHHSEETKEKIRKSMTGQKRGKMSKETKCKISKANKGRKTSEETKEKMRESRKRYIFTDEQKDKISKSHCKLTFEHANEIRQKYATGNYYHRHLAEEYNVSLGTIANVVKNRYYTEENSA